MLKHFDIEIINVDYSVRFFNNTEIREGKER